VVGLQNFSDQELVALIKEGDHAAYQAIYQRFFSLLYVHAVRRLNDDEEAGNIVQELFAYLWDKRETLEISGSLSCYLYGLPRKL
jgi:RNA polymerase sigma-70 factor (ECF subfamily)